MGAVLLSTAWALPAGVVIGRSPRLARALQPVIQVVASFPAPMLFPVVVLLFERNGVGLGLAAVALMVLAGQRYVLFNVISAVAAIPQQLKGAGTGLRLPTVGRWRPQHPPAPRAGPGGVARRVPRGARARGRGAGGPVRVRQEHAAAAVRRARAAGGRHRAVPRTHARRRARRRGDGIPVIRAAALAHGGAERGDGPRGAWGARPRPARRRRPRHQPRRARRVRAGLPQGAVGRHEAAGRLRASPRRRARDPPDGRAIWRARPPHGGEPAEPGRRPVARPRDRREYARRGHAQRGGGRVPRRTDRRVLLEA